MTHGRESFYIMDAATTFGKQNKITLTKSCALVIIFTFILCVIGTGVIVFYCTPCPKLASSSKQVACVYDIPPPSTEVTATGLTALTTLTSFDSTTESVKTDKVYLRLPRSVIPHSYEIKLIPFIFEGNFTFHGDITILVNVTENCNNITLHAHDIEVNESSAYLVDELGQSANNILTKRFIPITSISNDTARQFLIIKVGEDLLAGRQYSVRMKYKGNLNDHLEGFYRSSYKLNNQTRWIAATQFQPTDARRAFPCFDEPALKAKFKISIARFKNMSSISNMPLIGTPQLFAGDDNYMWDHFQESVPMSTYLVAFVVSDFNSSGGGKFSVSARSDGIAQASYSLEIGPKILSFYEQYFQIKFPLPKIDMIAIPDFSAGAMENWGLITFRESAMFFQEGISTSSDRQKIATVVAHELAHQWFGNLVTPSWWTDLWLNEGFASYMEYIGTNAVSPDWKVLDQFVVNDLQQVFALDALITSHPISVVVNNPIEINDIFDRISYAKGASIIRMMEHFLTSDVFRKGLHEYLENMKYSSAEQDDLWAALTTQAVQDRIFTADMSVKQIMDTWTLQTGFPVVTATRNYQQNKVVLTQRRFLIEDSAIGTQSPIWWVPVTYASRKTPVKLTWMRAEPEIRLNLNLSRNDWLLVNVNVTGYYRVNYDTPNWQLIIDHLLDPDLYEEFDPKNRAQFLNDALNLASAGLLDYEIALNVTTYLKHERDYVPWKAAFAALNYISDMFVRTGQFNELKVYMLNLLNNIYEQVGFRDSPSDPQLLVYSRIEILWRACKLGHISCITNAVTQFHNWRFLANPDESNPISPNLKNVIYCMAIYAGGQDEWEFAWRRYLNTKIASEREIILSALGCSREVWLLSRYLEWAVTPNSGIRKQDLARVFASVSNNAIGQELTYKFVKVNWAKLKKMVGSSALNAIVRTCTSKFNTQLEVDDLKAFARTESKETGVAYRAFQQSIEQSEANVRWMNKYYNKIVKWLKNFNSHSQQLNLLN